jgi:hypothetical protein
MDAEMTPPTAVATLATVIIEIESLSRMMVSVYLQCAVAAEAH